MREALWSTCEAEYISFASAIQESIDLEQLLGNIDKYQYAQAKVHEDNLLGRSSTDQGDRLCKLYVHNDSTYTAMYINIYAASLTAGVLPNYD